VYEGENLFECCANKITPSSIPKCTQPVFFRELEGLEALQNESKLCRIKNLSENYILRNKKGKEEKKGKKHQLQ